MPTRFFLRFSLAALLATLLTSSAVAQSTSTPAIADQADDEVTELDRFVVTGRAGAGFRTKAETSYALTDVSNEQLRLQAPMGVAEALKAIPGFWVEASGGEASANIRARGIPVEGYSTLSLQEDGIPIQHDAGLGWLNADQSFRMDETIERLEVVRGGPASIFASNAPGGIANFVTRKGGDTPEGLLKYEIGDFGRHRVDAWYGGPAGAWTYGVGGFWRIDNGIRDPGYRANDGYQFRLAAGRKLERGQIDVNVKHLDDQVIFFLGVPLTFDSGGDPTGVPNFDPNYGTFSGPETARMTLRNANGPKVVDVSNGTAVDLTQLTVRFSHELGADWRLENGFRYRDSKTVRNGFFPGTLTAGETRLNQLRASSLAAFPGATDIQFRYVTSPDIFNPTNQNGTGLMQDGAVRSIEVQLDEIINDLQLVKTFEFGQQKHDVALGVYIAAVDEVFRRYSATIFTDVRHRARLLDLVALDATGNVVGSVTEGGVLRHGSEYANGSGDSFTTAVYLSDEWQITPHLRIDLGARWEKITAETSVERSASVNLGGPTGADNNVLAGTGVYDSVKRSFDELGWTVGADWQFTPRNGIFARYTPTFRLPSVGDFITNATARPIIQEMDLYEAGYKYATGDFDLFATMFYTKYNNFGFSELVFDQATGGFVSRTEYTTTKTYGLEFEGTWRALDWFDLSASATWQQPEFGDFKVTQLSNGVPVVADYTGNQLLRVPEVSLRVIPGFNLMGKKLRLQFPVEYYGDRYSDAANTVKLPGYLVFNGSLRYDINRSFTLYVNVDNIDNEIGLTEGNPRTGQFQSGDAGARYFIARPILGRSYRAALTYRF
jgi:catecholate siderophore receptor